MSHDSLYLFDFTVISSHNPLVFSTNSGEEPFSIVERQLVDQTLSRGNSKP